MRIRIHRKGVGCRRRSECRFCAHRRQLKGSARGPERGPEAQGFNRGLGVLMRCAERAPQCDTPRRIHISPKTLRRSRATFRAHCLDGGYPGLKPWAEILSPFRGEMLARSLKLTPMGLAPQAFIRSRLRRLGRRPSTIQPGVERSGAPGISICTTKR